MNAAKNFATVEHMNGYLHAGYAQSLVEFGTPRELPQCGGWILQRQIPGFPYWDGMGCYPLFACRDWSQLHSDLESLGKELVSLSLVADPFGDYDLAYLHKCFDVVIPFKERYIIDARQPIHTIVSKNHRYYARKSLRSVHVEMCPEPIQFIDEWVELYANIIKKHNLKGVKAFSKDAFAKQLSIPGIVMFRALHQGIAVGAYLWCVQGKVAYGHLGAFSPKGYTLMVSYALIWSIIEHYINKLDWIDLGGNAGSESNDTANLNQFKRGWSTGTRTTYFCGRIFDREKYAELVEAKGIGTTDYFPAYRKGEFG